MKLANNTKVLITGSSGFIGNEISQLLVSNNYFFLCCHVIRLTKLLKTKLNLNFKYVLSTLRQNGLILNKLTAFFWSRKNEYYLRL